MENGEFEELLFEGETIQLLTSVQKPSTIAEISRKFKLIMQKDNINHQSIISPVLREVRERKPT